MNTTTKKETLTKAEEMHTLQKYYGTVWINQLLGSFESYIFLRENNSFSEINKEIQSLEK